MGFTNVLTLLHLTLAFTEIVEFSESQPWWTKTEKHFYFNSTKGFPCLLKSESRSTPHCLGKTKGRIHPVIDEKAIERLNDFYRPFNEKFYQMTFINFGWS